MRGIATVQFTWSSEADRPAEEKTVETYLAEAAAAGCDGVEALVPGMAELGPKYGLATAGAYVGAPAHLPWDEWDAEALVMEPARKVAELRGDYLVVNCDPKCGWGARERKTEDELKRQGEHLTRLAERVAALGLDLAMHNHANRHDLHLDDLRSVTDYAAESVGICLDTGWSWTSEDEPVARAKALGPRVTAVHLRNQVGERPTEWLGEGDLDLGAFLAELKANGYAGWLTTELWHREDVPRTTSLLENQKRSNALLREWWAQA